MTYEEILQQMNNQFRQQYQSSWTNLNDYLNQYHNTRSYSSAHERKLDDLDKELISQIKSDTIEYFNNTFKTTKMDDSAYRKDLTKEQKERVVGFMKKRLESYLMEGFAI